MSNNLHPEDNLPLIKESNIELQAENSTISGGMQAIQGNNNTQIQQDVARNQGQAIGQMYGSQALSVQEVREGGFFVAGNVIFQNSRLGNVQPTLYKSEREPPSLLPYLPNRSEQEFELGKALQLLLKQVPPHPLVCIIHGDEFQSHDKFLERLRKFSLPRWLGLDPNQTVIKEYPLNWPAGLKNLDELRERLRTYLADSVLGYSLSSLEEIHATFCKYPNPIIIHTHLLTEDWQQQGFEILNKLLEFWQNWPDLIPGQKLIICVFIKYQIKRQKHIKRFSFGWIFSYLKSFYKRYRYQSINNNISRQLEVLAASKIQHFDRLSCTVLPKLTGVRRTHVENWVRSEETKQFMGEVMIERLIDAVRDMFDNWEEQTSFDTIPMDDLAEELTRLLKSLTVTN
jgi:inactive STAND